LEEETRHSLSIEGYFASEQELKVILSGRKSAPEILNYYSTARSHYTIALQYHLDRELWLDVSMIRGIHSGLYYDLSRLGGVFRDGPIQIQGAKVRPPATSIEGYVRSFVSLSKQLLQQYPILPAVARLHTLFESIHPFQDGNGRAGRILLNTVLVNQGFPPTIIKGIEKTERDRYYQALEVADIGFHQGFPAAYIPLLAESLEQGNFEPLESLLYEGLRPRLDQWLAAALEQQEPLVELKILAHQLGVKETTLRQWVVRGKLIAVKRGRKLHSHSRLVISANSME